jgi:glycosyltransferase involved in cell wall biosynthesis
MSKHVLYVLTKLELGGAQKVCLALLKGVDQEGVPCSLLSGTEGVLVPEAQKHHSVYLLNSLKREVGFFCEFSSFFKMISVMRKLKKEHPELIVHTHSTKAGFMGRWAAFFARVKKRIHTVHGFGFHDHQAKIPWLIHFSLEYITSLITTHYVCVSNADKKTGEQLFPRFAKKSSIIRAAVDWDKFTPATKTASNPFIFGTISCMKPQKNLIDLLRAFKWMHDQLTPQQEVILQIIGDGQQRPMIEQWLRDNNMTHHVDLLGWQSDVSKWLNSWNVFTMSSLWEGLPCAIIEARLCKLPVISYNIAGIPEVIKDGKNGFLITSGDWLSLGQKMKAVFENQTLYEQLSVHQEDLSDYHNNTMIKRHVELYQRI